MTRNKAIDRMLGATTKGLDRFLSGDRSVDLPALWSQVMTTLNVLRISSGRAPHVVTPSVAPRKTPRTADEVALVVEQVTRIRMVLGLEERSRGEGEASEYEGEESGSALTAAFADAPPGGGLL
jgi:hypothetical protein